MRVLFLLALCLAATLASTPSEPQCTSADCLNQPPSSPSADSSPAPAQVSTERNQTITINSNALIGSKVEGVWDAISDFGSVYTWFKEYSATKIIKGRGNVVGTIRESQFGRKVVRDKLTKFSRNEFKLHYSTIFRGDPEKNENELVWHSHEVSIELFPNVCGGLASTFLRMSATFEAPVSELAIARARVHKDFAMFFENLNSAAKKFKSHHGMGGARYHSVRHKNDTHSLWAAFACPFQASANAVWQAAFPLQGDSLHFSAYFPPEPRSDFAYRRMYHLPESGRHGYGSHWVEDVLSVDPVNFVARVSMNFSEMSHHHIRLIHDHVATRSIHRVHHQADMPYVDSNPQVVMVVENQMKVSGEDAIEHNKPFWTYFADMSFRAIQNGTRKDDAPNKVTKRFSTLISFNLADTVEMFSDYMAIQDIFTGFSGQDQVRPGYIKNRFEVRARTGPRPEDVKLLQFELTQGPKDHEGYVRTFRLQAAGHIHWMREWAVTIVLADSVTSEYRTSAATFATVTLEYTPGKAYKPGTPYGDFYLMDPSTVIGEVLLRHCQRHASIHSAKHRTLRVSAPVESVMASLRSNDSSWVPFSRGTLGVNRQGTARWIDVSNYAPVFQTLLTLPNSTSAGAQGPVTTQHLAFMFDPPHVFDSRVFIILVSVRPVGAQQEASAVTLTNYLMHSYAYMHEPAAAHDLAHKYVSRVNDKLLEFLHRRARAQVPAPEQRPAAANSFQAPAPASASAEAKARPSKDDL